MGELADEATPRVTGRAAEGEAPARRPERARRGRHRECWRNNDKVDVRCTVESWQARRLHAPFHRRGGQLARQRRRLRPSVLRMCGHLKRSGQQHRRRFLWRTRATYSCGWRCLCSRQAGSTAPSGTSPSTRAIVLGLRSIAGDASRTTQASERRLQFPARLARDACCSRGAPRCCRGS